MADSSQVDSAERQPLYNDVSTQAVTITRITGLVTLVMALLSFIFCIVKGKEDHTFYLLACNLIISGIMAVVTSWWYKHGDLQPDKYWYVILVGAVIIFQCLTTDVYVFNKTPINPPATLAPPTTVSATANLLSTLHSS